MKILMLHNRYLVAGGEDPSTLAEVAILREYGHEVEYLEQDNRRVEQLGQFRTGLRAVWSRESYRRINDKLRGGDFDVMHVQNFFPLWSPSVYYAASHNNVPVVQTLHNYRMMCLNSFFFREQHVCEECLGKLPWRGILHACYRDSRPASAAVAAMTGLHRLIRTWERRVQMYIAVSQFTRDKYITGGIPAEKIAIKPYFIHPSPKPGAGGGGYAIFVGRLSAEKGIATMLEAWTTAQDVLPLRIVGHGPLEQFVAQAASTSANIEFLGTRPFTEVLELMGKAEFLVFPSQGYETLGRTIMEAFAVGTPVVTTKLGPPASMVVPGKTGFHFQPGNVAELRERIEWCSQNLAAVRSMRPNARQAFEENYTGPANLEMLIKIYRQARESLLGGRSRSGGAQL